MQDEGGRQLAGLAAAYTELCLASAPLVKRIGGLMQVQVAESLTPMSTAQCKPNR